MGASVPFFFFGLLYDIMIFLLGWVKGMNLIVIALMYGLLLYVVLGGFLLTVCTDYPEFLKRYRLDLMQVYGQNYLKTVLVLLYWYVIGIAIWWYWVIKHRSE